jgi:ABC-type transporter Mla subunit MlaD
MTINSQYFTNLEQQMGLCQTCAELQSVVNGAMAPLKALTASINTQLTALNAYLALITPPTDLNSLIQWVENFITVAVGPQAAAYQALVTQLAQLTAAVADLENAINKAAAEIEGCVIIIPS